ncbi:GntP family permease [Thermosediminibacter oceani]|uniref:Predicted D-glycerate permease (TC 2.A.8.1.6) n=1 Tax=Thermosediminibacter oceani (strain ATCC BAA-1034 / DSM 16646 / JW/IW-1228P) TaxID=555079 RepID=D9S1Z2_THEOJ|nr:GntP family permease [Thermosediminibacter oceani]ADL07419.1 predicted D-glycerate permease (TC 2.A.8.1.6) [Thermosediminibacter oceani DSM 16646]
MTPEQLAAAKAVMVHGPLLIIIVVLAILFIIFATAKLKIHPFMALLLAAYGVGFLSRMPVEFIGPVIAQGFGNLMTNIGLVIVFGTIIGTIMEKSGAALKMAEVVLDVVGIKRSPLAMSIIGYITSIPVFCDSGYVILTPLNKALAKRAKIPMAIMAVALSTGLYATHTLVPPTPGPIAAAGNVGADLGLVILVGMVVSIPAALTGLWWAYRLGRNIESEMDQTNISYDELKKQFHKLPGTVKSFIPIVVPILLIAFASVAKFTEYAGPGSEFIVFFGTPVNALMIGMLLSLTLLPRFDEETLMNWVGQGIKDSAIILLITGAGGSLGAVLSATPISDYIKTLAGGNVSGGIFGLILVFVIAALLKTAQGSSTVALVTTSSLIAPMLPQLGLTSPMDLALTVMAIGAGAMTVSHVNDSYFWVVSQFSGLKITDAYKAQTMGTLLEGLVSFVTTLILFVILH